MTDAEYFRHIRALAAFPASQALTLARQAAALDQAARTAVPPATVSDECLPDGSGALSLSFGIKVF